MINNEAHSYKIIASFALILSFRDCSMPSCLIWLFGYSLCWCRCLSQGSAK